MVEGSSCWTRLVLSRRSAGEELRYRVSFLKTAFLCFVSVLGYSAYFIHLEWFLSS